MFDWNLIRRSIAILPCLDDVIHDGLTFLIQHRFTSRANEVFVAIAGHGKKPWMHMSHHTCQIHLHVTQIEFFKDGSVLEFAGLQ